MKLAKVAGITIVLLLINNTNHNSGHYVTVYIDDIRLAEIMITLVTINKTDGIRKYVTAYIDNISNTSFKKDFISFWL